MRLTRRYRPGDRASIGNLWQHPVSQKSYKFLCLVGSSLSRPLSPECDSRTQQIFAQRGVSLPLSLSSYIISIMQSHPCNDTPVSSSFFPPFYMTRQKANLLQNKYTRASKRLLIFFSDHQRIAPAHPRLSGRGDSCLHGGGQITLHNSICEYTRACVSFFFLFFFRKRNFECVIFQMLYQETFLLLPHLPRVINHRLLTPVSVKKKKTDGNFCLIDFFLPPSLLPPFRINSCLQYSQQKREEQKPFIPTCNQKWLLFFFCLLLFSSSSSSNAAG